MSCFIVNPKSVVFIANFIADHINMGMDFTHVYTEISGDFRKLVCDKNNYAEAEKIYKVLYKLNYDSFYERYEDRHMEDLEQCNEWSESYSAYNNPATVENSTAWYCQLLKSCQCFLYQCSESEELENSVVYKTVKSIINGIKDHIIMELPEYQDAEWD